MNLDYYAIGLSVGVVFAVLLCAILRLVQKRKDGNCQKEEYDERQIIARGVAYRNGMFAMFIYNAIYAVLDLSEIVWCETFVGLSIGVMVGAAVYSITAIRRDAYLAFNKNMKSWVTLGVLIVVSNLISGIIAIADHRIIVDGKLATSSISIMVAVLWLAVLITQIIHNRRSAAELTEDEE